MTNQVRLRLINARTHMSDGAYKLIGGSNKVLGYVLVKKGKVTSFTPHGLRVVEMNTVFHDVSEGKLDGYTLKPVTNTNGPATDAHSFYVTNTNKREAWRMRKESEKRRAEMDPRQLEKEMAKFDRKLQKV